MTDELPVMETIRDRSRFGWAKDRDIVDDLLSASWYDESDLDHAYDLVSTSNLPLAVLFCQLPMTIRLPEKWIRLGWEPGSPYVRFRRVGTIWNRVDSTGKFEKQDREGPSAVEGMRNAELLHDQYGILTRTQVLISFVLWGQLAVEYEWYLREASVASRGQQPRKTTDARRRLESYETQLWRKLRDEAREALNHFLNIYAVVCRDPTAKELPITEWPTLCNCVLMVKNGRLVLPTIGPSMVGLHAQPASTGDWGENATKLTRAIDTKKIPTVYEEYLLGAMDQLDRGRCNLAVVQTVMVLEWFANEIIEDHLIRRLEERCSDPRVRALLGGRLWEGYKRGRPIRLKDKLFEYLPVVGIVLEGGNREDLTRVIAMRNEIVHRRPADVVPEEEARWAVEVGFQVIEESMAQFRKKFREEASKVGEGGT